ncbi:hypothetical protein AN216_01655 [Streptomyces oceani]|uniref:Uncharacterized protein n=1 Tax=Streptomyces oceani TaxID=1075402 RepID=A0A1E7KNY8_9ACTN|nr:hypothetical protein AN216_01655 [Streptomyces oceani]
MYSAEARDFSFKQASSPVFFHAVSSAEAWSWLTRSRRAHTCAVATLTHLRDGGEDQTFGSKHDLSP